MCCFHPAILRRAVRSAQEIGDVPYDVTMVLESVEVLHVQVLPESTNGARRFTVADFVVFGSPVFCSSGNQISTNLLPPVEPTA
jgi:hypothetical protein